METLNIFPQKIYKTHYKGDLSILINNLYSIQKKVPNNIKNFPKELIYQTPFNLFEKYSIYQELKSFIENLIKSNFHPNLKISESWGNIVNKYGYSGYHIHSPSIISGVLYLKVPPNSVLYIHSLIPGTGNIIDLPLYESLLLLFNGNQPHSTSPNISSLNKISISFNTIYS